MELIVTPGIVIQNPNISGSYKGMFANYDLRGRDWLAKLSEEDRKIFSYIGRMHNQHGRLCGLARAATAKRDSRGRFM